MKRRAILAGTGVALVAGCLGESAGTIGDPVRSGGNIEYEPCTDRIIDVEWLPQPAREEAIAAIEDGEYETDGAPIIADVMDLEESYLKRDGSYYEGTIEESVRGTWVRFEEVAPRANDDVEIRNGTDEALTLDLRIEFEGDRIVDETVPVGPEETVSLERDAELRYGSYTVEIEWDGRSMEGAWELAEHAARPVIAIRDDEATAEVTVAVDPGGCRWNDDGTVESMM